MIFVTVGTQLPFDRMIRIIDEWAESQRRTDILAQIGPSNNPPSRIEWVRHLPPREFRSKFRESEMVIAHAGMGSILTAMELGKPLIIMPRRADLGEHRNDHQIATARRFLEIENITVTFTDEELRDSLHRLTRVMSAQRISRYASGQLVATVRKFIQESLN